MMGYTTVPTRLAAALLMRHGEVSLREIRALPMVENRKVALAIADLLAQVFNVERFERNAGRPFSEWEETLRLVPSSQSRVSN